MLPVVAENREYQLPELTDVLKMGNGVLSGEVLGEVTADGKTYLTLNFKLTDGSSAGLYVTPTGISFRRQPQNGSLTTIWIWTK